MSFQHFRLAELAMSQPLPAHLASHQVGMSNMNVVSNTVAHYADQTENSDLSASFVTRGHTPGSKAPYGSGDSDDGYTLVFPNLQTFNEWRMKEEETHMIEFVKGDTHGSKAVPPRFKDHTKLVCARHSRSGRKKYVKKHPDRVRKVPSRKLEGQGCPASISYKTYFDTDEVRACYNSHHSHDIGLANLPFTRRGRKAAAQQEKEQRSRKVKFDHETSAAPVTPITTDPGPSPVTAVPHHPQSQSQPQPVLAVQQQQVQSSNQFSSAVSMIAPLPPQNAYQVAYGYPPPYLSSGERWDRMATLFSSVREHARSFEYPAASVAALESCLIRLYLESPVGNAMMQGQMMARPLGTGHSDASGSDESS